MRRDQRPEGKTSAVAAISWSLQLLRRGRFGIRGLDRVRNFHTIRLGSQSRPSTIRNVHVARLRLNKELQQPARGMRRLIAW